MNKKQMKAAATKVQVETTNTKETTTMNKIYTNCSDGIRNFTIKTIEYKAKDKALRLTGTINPINEPDKAVNFLYVATGKPAQYQISDIMEQIDDSYKLDKELWFTNRRFDKDLKCPMYNTEIPMLKLDQAFTVIVSHYQDKYIQIDFSEYRVNKAKNIVRDCTVIPAKQTIEQTISDRCKAKQEKDIAESCPQKPTEDTNEYQLQVNNTKNKAVKTINVTGSYKTAYNELLNKYKANKGYTIYVSDINKGKTVLTFVIKATKEVK